MSIYSRRRSMRHNETVNALKLFLDSRLIGGGEFHYPIKISCGHDKRQVASLVRFPHVGAHEFK